MNPRVFAFLLVLVVGLFAIFGTWLAERMEETASGVEVLQPREWEVLTLVTVGTGGAHENHLRRGPCIALGLGRRVVLVDAGRGVAEGLRASKIPVSQPDTVFLTSLLPENTVGLDDLLFAGWLAPREQPLRVVGPPGTRALLDGLTAAHAQAREALEPALGLPAAGASFEAVEVTDGWSGESDGLAVRAAAVEGAPLPSLAWRFEAGAHSVVVSGSGPASDAVATLAEGADVLVHEALYGASIELAIESGADDPEALHREAALHASLTDAARAARSAGVGTLVLVRLRPPPLFDYQYEDVVAETYGGQVAIPEDGAEFAP